MKSVVVLFSLCCFIQTVFASNNTDVNGSVDISKPAPNSEMTGNVTIPNKTDEDDKSTVGGYVTVPGPNEYFIV